jgi:cell division protein FtsI/penicillin-binding protein 2
MTIPADGKPASGRRPGAASSRRHRFRATRRTSVFAALLLVCGLAAACTGAPDPATGPEGQIAGLISAWQGLDPDKAADFTSDSAAAAVMLKEVFNSLRPDSVQISTGEVTRNSENTATEAATLTWELPDAGSWTYPATWTWQRSANGSWLLDWSPAVVHPKLSSRQTLAVQTTDPQDGVLVDRNNNQIVSPVRVYSVVLLPAKVPDVAAAAAAIAPILAPLDPTVTADSIVTGAAAALAEATAPASPDPASAPAGAAPSAGPDSAASTAPVDPSSVGYTITNIREPDYLKIKAQLDAVPGLSLPSEVRNLPPTRDFAKALLAQVTPVADAKMKGTAGWKVIIVDSTGGTLETLEDHPAVPGERVTITLDSTIQQAAEAAIAATAQPAMLLAMQPSTGEILAVAQNAAANAQGTPALTGQYPPGSTFKVVTATAGLDAGLIAPGQPVDCPGQFVIDGREIHNAHDFALGTVDVTLAFAKSCNTTFAKVATQLGPDVLTSAATDYGIGLDFVMAGATTLTGKVPSAATIVQRAESGFGQGEVLVTPFGALLMAATADRGTMPMPVLIRGTQTTVDKPAPVRPAAVTQGIQTFMRAVIDEGTGAGLEQFGDIHAKTGTAEFTGADGATHAHAWTIGYRGDLAFVAMVVGGEDSIVTNQITAAWLSALPS